MPSKKGTPRKPWLVKSKGNKTKKVWDPTQTITFFYRNKFNQVKQATLAIGTLKEFAIYYVPWIGKTNNVKGAIKRGYIRTTQDKYYNKLDIETIRKLMPLLRKYSRYTLTESKEIKFTLSFSGNEVIRYNKIYSIMANKNSNRIINTEKKKKEALRLKLKEEKKNGKQTDTNQD